MTAVTNDRTITIISGVSLFDGRGYCEVSIGGKSIGQLEPVEVREMAMAWLGAADAAESDAAVVAQLRGMEIDEAGVSQFLLGLRELRVDE